MKNLLFITGLSLMLFSCGKDNSVLPVEGICQLTYSSAMRTLPSADESTNTTTYYADSIVNIDVYNGSAQRDVYVFNQASNTIERETRVDGSNELLLYGTYYLDQVGLIDSFIRRDGATDEVNYRSIITRNSKNQIIRDVSSYITYGHDRRFFYDENGDYSYGIEMGQGTQTYNDTIIYTLDMTKPNNGSAQYLLEELNGKTSAHHVVRKQYLNRSTLIPRKESRWTISGLDSDGNPSSIKYEIDLSPGATFNADYSFNRSYMYSCQ